jgi:gamma-glutamyl:cysteine ligase YbdK (ATP-grasp superfamily)
MTTDEKVDKIYARVYNGLSENVAETRADVKELTANVAQLTKDFEMYIATRGQTCPFQKKRGQLMMQRKADIKYYVTTAIALGALLVAVVL